jgi:16S rRNA processing protein RimM
MPKQKPTEWATIGKIVAPFGVRGEIKVFSLSDVPNRFAQLESLYITNPTVTNSVVAHPTSSQHARVSIESVRPYKGDMYLLKLKGFDDATSVDALRNSEICIPLAQLAKLPADSYYQHDILGLRVLTLQEEEIGSIVDIMETGSNDVYVVKNAESQQFLIPAIKEVIKQVDLIRHVMYIEPMPGLLDDRAVLDRPETSDEDEHEDEHEKEVTE